MEASKLQSWLAKLENGFKKHETEFSKKDRKLQKSAIRILKEHIGRLQAKKDKQAKRDYYDMMDDLSLYPTDLTAYNDTEIMF